QPQQIALTEEVRVVGREDRREAIGVVELMNVTVGVGDAERVVERHGRIGDDGFVAAGWMAPGHLDRRAVAHQVDARRRRMKRTDRDARARRERMRSEDGKRIGVRARSQGIERAIETMHPFYCRKPRAIPACVMRDAFLQKFTVEVLNTWNGIDPTSTASRAATTTRTRPSVPRTAAPGPTRRTGWAATGTNAASAASTKAPATARRAMSKATRASTVAEQTPTGC